MPQQYIPKRFRVPQRRIFPGDRRFRPQAVKLREAYELRMSALLNELAYTQQPHTEAFDLPAQAVLKLQPFPFPPGADPIEVAYRALWKLAKLLPRASVRGLRELAAIGCAGYVHESEYFELVMRAIEADGSIDRREPK